MSPRDVLVLVFAGVAMACSTEQPTFSLESATVDDVYWCPGGARDARYDMHATVEAHNGTGKEVTVQSASAELVLTSVTGTWLESVGDRYDAGAVTVRPATVAARSNARLDVTIPSACTSGRWGPRTGSSGSYKVTVKFVTSAGEFAIAATNEHKILAA